MEVLPRLELQHHTGEIIEEFLHFHAHTPLCRVAEEGMALIKAFQHEKVIEAPEEDAGKARLFRHGLAGAAIGACIEAVAAASHKHLLGIGAIAVHAAGLAQFPKLHHLAEIGEDRGQGGCTAFSGFVLKPGARLHPLPLQALHGCWFAGAAVRLAEGCCGGDHPKKRRRAGSTSAIGGTVRVVISTSRRSPGVGGKGRSPRELHT